MRHSTIQQKLLRLALLVGGAALMLQLLTRFPAQRAFGLVLPFSMLLVVGAVAASLAIVGGLAFGAVRRPSAAAISAVAGLALATLLSVIATTIIGIRLAYLEGMGTFLALRGITLAYLFVVLTASFFPTTWGLAVLALWLRQALVTVQPDGRVSKSMKLIATFAVLLHVVWIVAWRVFMPTLPPS